MKTNPEVRTPPDRPGRGSDSNLVGVMPSIDLNKMLMLC